MHNARPHNRIIYLTVFTGGAATLAVELAASRLLGARFGTSNIVWASVIGLILVCLTGGYFLGGWWADRDPSRLTFFRIAAWSALLGGLIPFAAQLVLPAISQIGLPLSLGVILALVILFSVPAVLFGSITPFAIRLVLDTVNESGRIAGRIYAVSTLGSAVGALLPVLYLLPETGTTATFILFALGLLLVALWGLATQSRSAALTYAWMPVLLLILWLIV